jgi:formylglycine-generating enzyme required for sulfatase activity
MNFRRIFFFSAVSLLIFGFAVRQWQTAEAQTQPLTYPEIFTALKTKLPNKSFKSKTELINWLIVQIKQRRVDKPLTADREDDLRQAGATGELIEAIRQNSPPISKPTPVPNHTPIVINIPKTFKNPVGMEFVLVPAGTFMMGSPTSEKSRRDDETQHRVTISKDFYLGKYEVTQEEYEKVMEKNPSYFKNCPRCPVEQVSWGDAQEFIKKLNAKGEGTYRLPTEAEWEYAARAGTTTPFGVGDGNNLSSSQANFDGNYPYGNGAKGKYLGKTAAVGSYSANSWGLYDMHGNVWEWCADWDGEYSSSAQTDPAGPSSGSGRVIRGGSWSSIGMYLRSAFRNRNTPSNGYNHIGFRVLRTQ